MQVAFSAFTDFGAVMALAIAIHNIPEVVPWLCLYPTVCPCFTWCTVYFAIINWHCCCS